MADEPDNPILRLLRQIRAEQQEIKAKLMEHDQRYTTFDQRFAAIDQRFEVMAEHIDERFDEFRDLMTHMLGVTSASELQLREQKVRLRDTDRWRQRTDEAMTALDRRVGKLEGQAGN